MDGVVLDDCKKRRLPLWMLGVSAADQVKKSRKGNSNDFDKIEKEEIASECNTKKSRSRRSAQCDNEVAAPCEDVLDDEQSNVVVRRQRVTRKRKAVRKDVASTSSDAEEAVIEKKSKRNVRPKAVPKSVSRRREKRKSKGFESSEDVEVEIKDLESSEDIEAASVNEDDEDLTMDDLISIAIEFVKDEKDMGQQKKSDEKDMGQQKKSDAEQILHEQCAPTDISINEPADSVVKYETVKRLPAHEETASCPNVISTDDPAQDMLDLLLGPLLTQPPKREKFDIITDEMITAHRFKKQQKLDTRDAAIPLAKKKTSLKDQIAMFLD